LFTTAIVIALFFVVHRVTPERDGSDETLPERGVE